MKYTSSYGGGGFGGGGGGFGFGFRMTPWVKRLLIANGVVFVLTLMLPAVAEYLAFIPSRVFVQPWGLITYMFVHAGFLHLLFNMVILFFFGPPLEARWGGQEFLKYYAICGLGAAALGFIFAYDAALVGASGALFGLMVAFAVMWPESPIYVWGIFPIKAKWLVAGLAALQVFFMATGGSGRVASFAHVGGLVTGFIYLKTIGQSAGHIGGASGFGDGFGGGGQASTGKISKRVKDLKKRLFGPRQITVHFGEEPDSDDDRPRRRGEDHMLDEVDRVLEKISTQGLSSLTPEERKLLDEMSRRYKRE